MALLQELAGGASDAPYVTGPSAPMPSDIRTIIGQPVERLRV